MKSFWKRFGAWVTALKDRPLRSARVKLTALYVLHSFIILSVFVTLLGYARISILRKGLEGQLADPAAEEAVIRSLWTEIQTDTAILVVGVLIALGVLSYISARLTLQPLRAFMEVQRRFIADASHELRTPLTTMRTEIEVALLDPMGMPKEELVSLLRSNVDEIDRMSKILTNLLNLAAFHDAAGAPDFAPLDLAEIARYTTERLRRIATAKQIRIQERIEPVSVRGNAIALEEVIANLLKNALHYSESGGEVLIRLIEQNGKAELTIEDQGIGIAEKDLPHVFEPFYRAERSLHMYKAGSGLGLPLVREIVKRHRGNIYIDSAPGKGTTITVVLPLAKDSV